MARAPSFDLARELAKASFTPAQRDAPALVELVVGGEEPAAGRASTALAGLGDTGRGAIEARLAGGAVADLAAADTAELGDAATARLVGALGLLARRGDAAALAALLARLNDSAVRVRRAAALALGKLGAARHDGPSDGDGLSSVRAALVARWDAGDAPPDERRALAEALGKVGGDDAIARLRAIAPGDDAELARRRDRALMMAGRDAQRATDSEVVTDVAPPRPLVVHLHCKGGLAPLLVDEVVERGLAAAATGGARGVASTRPARALGDAVVELELSGPLSALYAARLWTHLGVRVPLGELSAKELVRVLTAPATRALLRAWTKGPIRWRLGFAQGHKRALVWQVARDVEAIAPELVNDPTQTTWDVIVDDDAVELVPRRAADPRFAWRVAEVPAASHPTIAAALARVAGARDGDRVWDPFVGSGAELVERARLGTCGALAGTDLDEAALAAARANTAAAGVAATLVTADARTYDGGPFDLVITNPPLGSRVQVDAAALLVETLPNLARRLAPRGRLVWITPAWRKTTPVAEKLGLVRDVAMPVDLGGVRGQLERWSRR